LDTVKTALHANLSIEWLDCSDSLNYDYDDEENYMESYYQYLIDGNYSLSILVYSGDDDTVCGTLGTQLWITQLGYDIISKWSAWYVDEQVAGYKLKYDGISFVTVHDAGHEVPTYQPKRMFTLFEDFLNDNL